MKNKNFILNAYLNPKHSSAFSSVENVYREVKKTHPYVTKRQIEHSLQSCDIYTKHRPRKRIFPRKRVVAYCIDSDWQIDLADVKNIKKHNKQFTFILVAIDVLSKYCWAVPIKSKHSKNVSAALQTILTESKRKPERVFTDRGLEFRGAPFQTLLKENNIVHLMSQNDSVKASVAERVIRTIKTRLWKYFASKNTKNYVTVLPDIVRGINNTVHSSTKIAPVDVNLKNENKVWKRLYPVRNSRKLKFRFNIGHQVRIPKKILGFYKGYHSNYSDEIYVIIARTMSLPALYRIREKVSGEIHPRSFYQDEMIRVRSAPTVPVRKMPSRSVKWSPIK